jgi:hypothetical protein
MGPASSFAFLRRRRRRRTSSRSGNAYLAEKRSNWRGEDAIDAYEAYLAEKDNSPRSVNETPRKLRTFFAPNLDDVHFAFWWDGAAENLG